MYTLSLHLLFFSKLVNHFKKALIYKVFKIENQLTPSLIYCFTSHIFLLLPFFPQIACIYNYKITISSKYFNAKITFLAFHNTNALLLHWCVN